MKVRTKSEGRCWGRGSRPVASNIFCRIWTELSERLRLRRGRGDTSEDDEGLPRSPCCNSPTATEGLLDKTAVKDHPTKSHSTCSDGSLLSMGSSEIEEDSFGQQSSRHSSKLSLYDKKTTAEDSEWELGPSSASAPLNHSAAHHRVAVRPKRTHGAPRRKRMQPMAGTALPTTPEVNEDSSMRSLTPETSSKEIVTELHSSNSSASMSKTRTESQLKCSSLPPGLAGPGTESSKLNRSRSSAGGGSSSKSQDAFVTLGEEDEDRDDKKSDHSIFARLFPRRSGKKKKSKQESPAVSVAASATPLFHSEKPSDKRVPSADKAIRSGPASRQRIQPIDIPASPDVAHRELNVSPDRPSTSPLQLELENHFRQRTAPSPKFFETPPRSPKSPSRLSPSLSRPGLIWSEKSENLQYLRTSSARYLEGFEEIKSKIVNIEENKNKVVVTDDIKNDVITNDDSKSKMMVFSMEDFRNNKFKLSEESRSKVKIAGLSSLQQRVLQQHNDDSFDNTFKSLTDFTSYEQSATNRLVTKSHSFKSKSNDSCSNLKGSNRYTYTSVMSKSDTTETKSFAMERTTENSILKTNSLDSIENVQDDDHFEEDKCLIKSESSESLESATSAKTSSTEYLDSLNPTNGITISGPSHTSVVSVCTSNDIQHADSAMKMHALVQPVVLNVEKELEHSQPLLLKESFVKEEQTQISVTKVHVKRESMQVTQNNATTNKNNGVPEFLSIHLNKVDAKPATNVVLTANVISPKLEINGDTNSNQNNIKPKSTFCFESILKPETVPDAPSRKFSQDDIEVVDKDVGEEIVEVPSKNVSAPSSPPTPPNVIITSMAPPLSSRIYKKHSDIPPQPRKSSLVTTTSESKTKVSLRTKSNSLDIVDSLKHNDSDVEKPTEKSKVSSATDLQEGLSSEVVVMRRKSLVRQKQDDEPELMKVFARRSLKLKDADELAQQVLVMVESSKGPESDKENHLDSPPDERRKLTVKEQEKVKEPLTETKFVETTEVTLRKPINNKLFTYQQRTISLNVPKANEINNATEKTQKIERPKTEVAEKITNKTWITAVRKEPDGKDDLKKISHDDVIAEISSSKNDFINEDFPTIPKNFNQRKAEWEKRAQEALKKSVP